MDPHFNPNPHGFNPEPMIHFPIGSLGLSPDDYVYLETDNTPQPPYQAEGSQEHHSSAAGGSSSGGASNSTAVPSSTSTGSKRRRTALVWTEGHFEYRLAILDDGTKEHQALCKWPGCDKILSGASKHGTGHLDRHLKSHRVASSQAPGGEITNKHIPCFPY